MEILGNAWQKWITPKVLVNAAKRVWISATGLNVNWMDEEKFQAAKNLLEDNRTPQKKNDPNSSACLLESLVGVRKETASYYKYKLDQSLERIKELQDTTPALDEIPELLSFQQITCKNTTTTKHEATHIHGSMRANDIIKAVEKKADKEKLEEEKKQALLAKREGVKEKFYKFKQKCVSAEKDGKCDVFDSKECSVCNNILKSLCGKQAVKNASGEKPKMLLVDAALNHPKQIVRYDDTTDDDMSCVEESDDDVEVSDEDTEIDSLLAQKLRKVWKSLSPPNHEETLLGNWYGVIYEQGKKIDFVHCEDSEQVPPW